MTLLADSALVFTLKLGCSFDDLIWLPALLVSRRPATLLAVCATYLTTVLGLAGAALWMAHASQLALGALGWAESWLGIVGGLGLLAMAWFEWREAGEDAEEGECGDSDNSAAHAYGAGPARTDRVDSVAPVDGADRASRMDRVVSVSLVARVFWVSTLGSLDELGAYTLGVAGLGWRPFPVVLGTLVGTVLVLVLAFGLGQANATRRMLLRIPEWSVLAFIGALALGAGSVGVL